MGIGSVTSTNSMSGMQMITAASADAKTQKFQTEITNAQQQMQKLSSNEELSVNEKTNEKRELQKEISNLNTELKRHQEELRRSQKREAMLAELQEDVKPAKEEASKDKIQADTSSDKTDEKNLPYNGQQTGQQGTVITKNSDGTVILKDETNQEENRGIDTEKEQADETKKATGSDTAADSGLSHKEIHAIVSADSSVQQADRQGTVIAKTRDGIAILKGELRQDEKHGIDTEKSQAELEKMEKKEARAITFQFSTLNEAANTMKSAAKSNGTTSKDNTQVTAENNGFNNAFINALNASQQQEHWASQQMFHVSIGH